MISPVARYPTKSGPKSSHNQALQIIGLGSGGKVLDVGCAHGELALKLTERGWSVTGIEPDPLDAKIARSRGVEVVEMPVEVAADNLTSKYQWILIADVLEHLEDPGSALRSLRRSLSDGGKILVSVPNVAHISMRLHLLSGRFDYTERGILDRTHLRFFTKKTLRALIDESGFEVVSFSSTPVPIELILPGLRQSVLGRLLSRLNDALPSIWRGGFSYQLMVVLQPKSP